MTTSSPSKEHLKKLAGANEGIAKMIRQQLSTPDEVPKTQTSAPSPSIENASTDNEQFETCLLYTSDAADE